MVILGLNAFGQNPSACIVRDGRMESFCQEDRFTRLKGSTGHFPSRAVAWCLQQGGLTIADVSRLAFAWDCTKYPWHVAGHLLRAGLRPQRGRNGSGGGLRGHLTRVDTVTDYLTAHTPTRIRRQVLEALRTAGHGGTIPPLHFIDHHRAHALQAFYHSPFRSAAVLIADGSGEEHCVSGYHMKNGRLRRLFSVDVPFSLGWYYAAFTAYLGFLPNRDEGKLMGLAAYGEPRREQNPWLERLDRVLRVTRDGYHLEAGFLKGTDHSHHPRYTDALAQFITGYDPGLTPVRYGETTGSGDDARARYLLPGYVDLAYAVQSRLEEAVLGLAERVLGETGENALCLAGGVFMNCKVNGTVLARKPGIRLFVHPAAGDEGSCIGAAFAVAEDAGDHPVNHPPPLQPGPAFTAAHIRSCLDAARIRYTEPASIASAAAALVAQGKFVGWFQDGVEMGARALGGRSIVAHPGLPGAKERINAHVKFREPWRPYCPSMIDAAADLYLETWDSADHMIVAHRGTGRLAKAAPATVHVDGSVRPQLVREHLQPRWHALISAVGEYTGEPVVLNTSLNVRGEPVVGSPWDAIRCFASTGLDALAIGDFLIEK